MEILIGFICVLFLSLVVVFTTLLFKSMSNKAKEKKADFKKRVQERKDEGKLLINSVSASKEIMTDEEFVQRLYNEKPLMRPYPGKRNESPRPSLVMDYSEYQRNIARETKEHKNDGVDDLLFAMGATLVSNAIEDSFSSSSDSSSSYDSSSSSSDSGSSSDWSGGGGDFSGGGSSGDF